jgi:hypothetical protein
MRLWLRTTRHRVTLVEGHREMVTKYDWTPRVDRVNVEV